MMKFIAFKGLQVIALAMGVAILVAVISSCTIQQNQSLLSAKTTSGDSVQKILDKVPFAFDVAIDTISYNSCVGSDLNSSGLHGIKLGANEGFVDSTGTGAVKAGLKLRSDFLLYVAKNVDPTYPNTVITPAQIQYILQNSEVNKNLKIQYAVRSTTNLKVVVDLVQPSGTDAILPGRDGLYEGSILSNEPVLSSITNNVKFGPNGLVLAEGPRVYNVGSKSSPDPLEGALGYNQAYDATFPQDSRVNDNTGAGEQRADLIRAEFNSFKYILAVSFGNETTQSSSDFTPSYGFNSLRRKDEIDLKRAFGRGYELGFTSKNSSLSSWRKNILSKVTEKNLEDGRLVSGASWACENVVIMKTNELNNKKVDKPACAELIAKDLEDPATATKVKNIRRHYSEDQWAIGLLYKAGTIYNPNNRINSGSELCLVSKQTNCYLPTVNILVSNPAEDIGVQYNSNQECYLSRFAEMGVTYAGNKTGDEARRLQRCAQYASICTRSSTSF